MWYVVAVLAGVLAGTFATLAVGAVMATRSGFPDAPERVCTCGHGEDEHVGGLCLRCMCETPRAL